MRHRLWGLIAALVCALTVAACGGDNGSSGDGEHADLPGAGKPTVRLGTKNFTEQYIVAQLYAQALRAKGYTIEIKQDIGSTEVADKTLTSRVIDMYPEYTGTALSVVKGLRRTPMTPEQTYEDAKAFYARRGYTMLDRTPFQDRDALAVTSAFARRHGLRTMGDLRTIGRFTLAAPPEFRTRFAGLIGLRSVYKVREARFQATPIADVYPSLDAGRVQVADVFSTDAQIASGRYVVLEDPKVIFGWQNLAPVVNDKVLRKQGPAFAQTLNAVSAKLTDRVMRRLNAEVAMHKRMPASVARQFLRANALL